MVGKIKIILIYLISINLSLHLDPSFRLLDDLHDVLWLLAVVNDSLDLLENVSKGVEELEGVALVSAWDGRRRRRATRR
jgi:hypothetical protein